MMWRSIQNYFYLILMLMMLNGAFWSGAAYTYLKDEYEKKIYAKGQADILMGLPIEVLGEIMITHRR